MFWYAVFPALVVLFYFLLVRPQLYWARRDAPQGWPIPLLGDQWRFFFRLESFAGFYTRMYNTFSDKRYVGVYQSILPTLLIRDPELIKMIAIKDFDFMPDHRNFTPELIDPIWNRHLFALKGDEWRVMRATLSPSFTASKMRMMFYLMNDAATQLVKYYLDQNKNVVEINAKDTFTRYANDVIASCGFGIACNSLQEPKNEFYMHGSEITDVKGLIKNMKFFLNFVAPKAAAFLRLSFFPDDCGTYFKTIVKDTVNYRDKHKIVRPDMINLLMETRKGVMRSEDNNNPLPQKTLKLSVTDMAAQAIVFFFAGFDTSSTMMAFMAYTLAMHQDIQENLRAEVDEVFEATQGKLTYETLMEMEYLEKVLCESLRMYPPIVATDRLVSKPYVIEPEMPGEEPVHISEGDTIWIPIYPIHHDPQYFEDPERFDPERFSPENKALIQPYTYLPFGLGPRICIGSRFSMMEIKILFFHILSNFEIVPTENTPLKNNLRKGEVMLQLEGGFWVGLKRRQNVKNV